MAARRAVVSAVLLVGCTRAPDEVRLAPPPPQVATPPVEQPAAPPAVAAAPDGSKGLPVVDAIVAGDRLIALEQDGSVVARELDGVEVWRARLGPATQPGAELIQRLPGAPRVLVRRPGRLVTLELGDGRVAAQHDVELADRLYMWARDGACGLRGKCSMQLIDCALGRPLGRPIEGKIRYERDLDGEGHSSGCWGFDVELVGRAGDVVVHLSHDSGGGSSAFGVSAQDGRPVWSSTAVACRHCPNERFGMSPGGTWCFAVEDEAVALFTCRTGEVRATRKVAGVRRALWVGEEDGGIFVDSPGSAGLIDPGKNRWRWQVKVPDGALAVPRRARLTDLADVSYGQDKPTPLLVLDEATGAVTSRTTLQPGGAIVVAADGSVSVTSRDQDRDHTGQLVPSSMPPPAEVERSREPAGSSGPPNHAVVRRPDGTIVATIADDAWPLGWTRRGDEVRLAVMIAGTPRTVALYRFTEARAPAKR